MNMTKLDQTIQTMKQEIEADIKSGVVNTNMTEEQALYTLRQVKARLGRTYKSKIRDAWMTGNYNTENLEEWAGDLQQIRNGFGPSWLIKANPRWQP